MRCEEKLGAGLPPLGELGLGLALDLQVSPCTVYINQSGFVCFVFLISGFGSTKIC